MHSKTATELELTNHRYPLSADLIESLAIILARDYSHNLSQITVFLNNASRIHHCRNRIVIQANDSGRDSILGPDITTLSLWASHYPIEEGKQLIDPRLRELILVEALLEHKNLYKNASPWALADSLLSLFDQLAMQPDPISKQLDQFESHLSGSYGFSANENPYLSEEAALVHQLWHAMQQQLSAFNYIDHATAFRQQLESALQTASEHCIYYFVGYHHPSPIEQNFIDQLSKRCEVHTISYSNQNNFYYQPDNKKQFSSNNKPSHNATNDSLDNDSFFNYIFSPNNQSLHSRQKDCLALFEHSPAVNKIKMYCADGRENEALAIQQQIRLWLSAGKTNIGFVSNNRKLARRVRALLERHGIDLKDESGWNLSTTSSAAILEQWLLCIDNDFHYLPLLDLLKSPFIFPNEDRQQRLVTVYRFEKQIVLHENIRNNIARYIEATLNRKKRLPDKLAAHLNHIEPLLQHVHDTAVPLLHFTKGSHAPADIITTLWQSLQDLGILASFSADTAGEQILDELNKLRVAAAASDIKISWLEFRSWLGHKLEHRQFQSSSVNAKVQIVNLHQTNLSAFDAVLVGAAEHDFLPSNSGHSPFFNSAVRKDLGLPGDEDKKNVEFILFRHLIEHAIGQAEPHQHQPPLLITHTRIVNDEEIQPSAWIELLSTNHQYFYNDSLYANYLQDYIFHQQRFVGNNAQAFASSKTPVQSDLLPSYFSASSYQQLVNCPYQFFVARCLKLEPPEQIREYLQKSDYGELVHLVLQAFHSDVDGLPGSFKPRVTAENKTEAISLLKEISLHVFNKYIEDNFAHRAWLNQWLSITTGYIEWLIERQIDWQIAEVEKNIDKLEYRNDVFLSARLDRIDKHQDKLSVIDYKTGVINSQEKVLKGEAVQLPFYALASSCASENDLQNNIVKEIGYLSLASDGVKLKNIIADDVLTDLQQQTADRLVTLQTQLRAGKEIVAWGDESVCAYCNMEGICRRQYREHE